MRHKSYGIDPCERCLGGELFTEVAHTLDCGHGRGGSGCLQRVSRPASRDVSRGHSASFPRAVTNFGPEVAGILTRRHDSSPCADRGQNVVAQFHCIGFKAGQSPDGGLGIEREVSPTLAAQPSALEPTVCHPFRREAWIGQIGTTERLGNAFWREVSYSLQTAGGDATPTVIQRKERP